MMDRETLEIVLNTWKEFAQKNLTLETKLRLDKEDRFPEEIIRKLLSPEIGMHLIFIPEEYGGLGGGAYDIYRVSEEMAKTDLGIATAFLAIALGTDPLRVGATEEQKQKWMRRIAEEGLIVAYGATEPQAGSNLANLKTKAEPIKENGIVVAYKLNGTKQFISNGSYADLYTILARAPEGPSFFIVEKGSKGLIPGKPEEKHGIRASNTAQVILEDCIVPKENLIGLKEGEGLVQASKVFAFTRVMVAAFGLGGGVSALEKAIAYSKERVQFETKLIEKQGFTHKLLVPHLARLEAVRAYIEEVATRLDNGEHNLPTEGAIAKYLATEYGNSAAEASIQAFGGYGYMREYEVEKIKRDVRITTIYEGTSEIQQSIIGINRWREFLQSKFTLYRKLGEEMLQIEKEAQRDIGGKALAQASFALNETLLKAKENLLTRQQHIQFKIADMVAMVEVGAAMVRKAYKENDPLKDAISRIYSKEVASEVLKISLEISIGSGALKEDEVPSYLEKIGIIPLGYSLKDLIKDMDYVAQYLREH